MGLIYEPLTAGPIDRALVNSPTDRAQGSSIMTDCQLFGAVSIFGSVSVQVLAQWDPSPWLGLLGTTEIQILIMIISNGSAHKNGP